VTAPALTRRMARPSADRVCRARPGAGDGDHRGPATSAMRIRVTITVLLDCGTTMRRMREVLAASSGRSGRCGQVTTTRRSPSRPGPKPTGTGGGQALRRRPHQPADRRTSVHQRKNGRSPPSSHLPEARDLQPRQYSRRAATHRARVAVIVLEGAGAGRPVTKHARRSLADSKVPNATSTAPARPAGPTIRYST
jgi:hypothetical protein